MRDSYWALIITLLVIAPRIISESLFRFTSIRMIWVFRIIDVFDIVLQTLSLLVIVLYIYSRHIHGQNQGISMVYLFLATMLMGGHMMHFAANAIDMHFREVLNVDPETTLPTSAYTLIHFIDEYLSHIIMFTALMLIFCLGAIIELQKSPKMLDMQDKVLIIISGFILGSGFGISAVEASIPIYILILVAICLIAILWYAKANNRSFFDHPFCLYVTIIYIMLLLSAIAYIAVFGFQSPRELIGSYLGGP